MRQDSNLHLGYRHLTPRGPVHRHSALFQLSYTPITCSGLPRHTCLWRTALRLRLFQAVVEVLHSVIVRCGTFMRTTLTGQ